MAAVKMFVYVSAITIAEPLEPGVWNYVRR